MSPTRPIIPVEEQFAIMADHAPVLIWISGPDKLCYFFNAGWFKYTGRTMEQEYGNGWAEGVHPNDLERCLEIYVNAFDARREFKMEYRLRRHDGVYQWLLDNGVPRYAADGSFAGYIGSCMVIDELLASERFKKEYISTKLLEEQQQLNEELIATNEELLQAQNELGRLFGELEISEARYRNEKLRLERFFMQAPAGICILDGPDMVFELINPLYQQLFPGRELLGKPLLEAIPELKGGPILDILNDVYRTGKTFDGRSMLVPLARTGDGPVEDRYFDFIYQGRTDAANEVDGVLVFVFEVTETVLKEAQIKEQAVKQAQLAAIVNSSEDSIISKTLQGYITSWNNAAERMFGYTEEEAIGRHISLLIPPTHLKEEDYIIDQIRQGNKVNHFETIRVAKDGRPIPLSLTISPITDENGQVIGASKIARDISDQKEAQEIAAHLYKQVKELNDKKDEFIGLASHELKTPLTSMGGYLQILSRMLTEEDSLHFVDKTLQQLKKLTALVNDLLDISKIEAGKLQFRMEQFDLKPLIEETIELMQHTTDKHKISFDTSVEACLIAGDSQRIEQVVANLLSNAIKYSPNADRVEVELHCTADDATVSIGDYGLGIAPDKLEHIFSRFYRVDDISSNISGLGIGLYLSQEIIDRHHGQLWVESEPGKGSVFHFKLPVKTARS
jgi:PAS domain S-box-containing protein